MAIAAVLIGTFVGLLAGLINYWINGSLSNALFAYVSIGTLVMIVVIARAMFDQYCADKKRQ